MLDLGRMSVVALTDGCCEIKENFNEDIDMSFQVHFSWALVELYES